MREPETPRECDGKGLPNRINHTRDVEGRRTLVERSKDGNGKKETKRGKLRGRHPCGQAREYDTPHDTPHSD